MTLYLGVAPVGRISRMFLRRNPAKQNVVKQGTQSFVGLRQFKDWIPC